MQRKIDFRLCLPSNYYTRMNQIEKELREKVTGWKKKMELIPIPKSHLFEQILIKHKNANFLFRKEYQVN